MVHEVLQREGGEQGDALMPALFSLGQHDALVAIQGRLAPDERLMAFLDDIYAVGERPGRTAAAYTAIQEEMRTHTGIEVHQGKTQLWNRAGVTPAGSAALTAAARVADPSAIVWRGDPHLPAGRARCQDPWNPIGPPQIRELPVGSAHRKERAADRQNLASPGFTVCLDPLVVLCFSTRQLHVAGGASEVDNAFAAQS